MEYYLTDLLAVEQIIDRLKDETDKFWFGKENSLAVDSFKQKRFYFLSPNQSYYWDKLNDLAKVCDFFGVENLDVNRTNIEQWITVLKDLLRLRET